MHKISQWSVLVGWTCNKLAGHQISQWSVLGKSCPKREGTFVCDYVMAAIEKYDYHFQKRRYNLYIYNCIACEHEELIFLQPRHVRVLEV